MEKTPRPDALCHVHELNKLFLGGLKWCTFGELDGLLFPSDAIAALRNMGSADIDAAATFPHALFRLDIGTPSDFADERRPFVTSAWRAIVLTVLLSVWTMARSEPHQTCLFLGLPASHVELLREMPLSALPRMAATSNRLVCAYADAGWLWRELLLSQAPGERERLALVALQPVVQPRERRYFDRVAEPSSPA